jgi:hypothetical protein
MELRKLNWIDQLSKYSISGSFQVCISIFIFRLLPTRGTCNRVSFTRQHRPSSDRDSSTDGRFIDFIDSVFK